MRRAGVCANKNSLLAGVRPWIILIAQPALCPVRAAVSKCKPGTAEDCAAIAKCTKPAVNRRKQDGKGRMGLSHHGCFGFRARLPRDKRERKHGRSARKRSETPESLLGSRGGISCFGGRFHFPIRMVTQITLPAPNFIILT